jgi:hypothetical protein
MAATINIPWNEYEAVLLVEACNKVISGEASKSDVIPELSSRLRGRMLSQGVEISETYRNENGITLQLSAMQYIMTNGEIGLPGGSALFSRMASLFTEDRPSFDMKLNLAQKIYPIVSGQVDDYQMNTESACQILEDGSKDNVVYVQQSDSDRDGSMSKKVVGVLRLYFSRGFRLNSTIEERRFKQFYEKQYSSEFPATLQLSMMIPRLGIQHENKVYLPEFMLAADVRDKIQLYIVSHFESSDYIYYDAILDKFSEDIVDSQIFDKETLKAYLQYYDVYGWSYGTFYISKTNSVSVNQDQDIIDFVRMQCGIVTENEILNAFHYMPKDYVLRCVIRNNRTLISCGRGYRFHIDNYRINDIEKNGIREIIRLSIQSAGYLTTSELARSVQIKYPSVLSDNTEYGIIGFRNVVSNLYEGEFSFYNNLISSIHSRLDTNQVFEDFCKSKATFTTEEVNQLADDLGTLINFDAISRYCVRVSESKFVSKDNIVFDVPATDAAIANYCSGEYVTILDINTFVAFPYCSYRWNNYLLESFVAQYSKQFKLMHSRYNKDNTIGAIVKRTSAFSDYDEILIDAVANSKVPLNENDVLDYLQEKGYIARRRSDFLSKISLLDKAAIIRNKKKI